MLSPSHRLPPVKSKKKATKRCFVCGKKTGLATSYMCRYRSFFFKLVLPSVAICFEQDLNLIVDSLNKLTVTVLCSWMIMLKNKLCNSVCIHEYECLINTCSVSECIVVFWIFSLSRCGNNFCASHRYAESHDCTFDYKTEGRKLLEQSNPVVSAPKLPKI